MHYWSLLVFLDHWHTCTRPHEPAGCVAICYVRFSSTLPILETLWPRLRDHTSLTPFSQNRLVPCVPTSSCRRRSIPQGHTQEKRAVTGACPECPFECTSTSGQQWVLFGYGLQFVRQPHVLSCGVFVFCLKGLCISVTMTLIKQDAGMYPWCQIWLAAEDQYQFPRCQTPLRLPSCLRHQQGWVYVQEDVVTHPGCTCENIVLHFMGVCM